MVKTHELTFDARGFISCNMDCVVMGCVGGLGIGEFIW